MNEARDFEFDVWPEICYNIHYVEKNGRNRGDPWSLRQMGVYQQVSLPKKNSVWIMLQPSGRCREHLDKISQANTEDHSHLFANPMLLHLHFLTAMAGQWEDYIQDLQDRLKNLVKRDSLHYHSNPF